MGTIVRDLRRLLEKDLRCECDLPKPLTNVRNVPILLLVQVEERFSPLCIDARGGAESEHSW